MSNSIDTYNNKAMGPVPDVPMGPNYLERTAAAQSEALRPYREDIAALASAVKADMQIGSGVATLGGAAAGGALAMKLASLRRGPGRPTH